MTNRKIEWLKVDSSLLTRDVISRSCFIFIGKREILYPKANMEKIIIFFFFYSINAVGIMYPIRKILNSIASVSFITNAFNKSKVPLGINVQQKR